jgi:hypothetical protein
MIPAGIFLLLLGAALWWLGRFGASVGIHPVCRACGFDLFMLPLETRRCPECGADILRNDAINIGHRRPVRTGIVIGMGLSALGAALLGFGILAWWGQYDGSPYKPASMLLADLRRPVEPSRTRALREFQRRVTAASLSDSDFTHLANAVLDLQADPTIPWNPACGDLLQAQHASRHPPLPPALWERYLRQSLHITARLRPRVRLGDPLPIEITCLLKAGTSLQGLAPVTLAPSITLTSIAGTALPPQRLAIGPTTLNASPPILPVAWTTLWWPGGNPTPGSDRLPAISPGAQSIGLTIEVALRDAAGNSVTTRQFPQLSFELLPHSASSVIARQPPADALGTAAIADFESALTWRLRTNDDGAISLAGKTLGSLWVCAPSTTCAFRVVIRQPGRGIGEWLLSRFMVQPNDATTVPLTLPPGAGLAPGPAEIVCVPDPTLAVGTLDILEVWGREVRHPVMLGP